MFLLLPLIIVKFTLILKQTSNNTKRVLLVANFLDCTLVVGMLTIHASLRPLNRMILIFKKF